jgi:hypothetical protein
MCYERQNVPQCHYSLFDILFLEQKTIRNESKRKKKRSEPLKRRGIETLCYKCSTFSTHSLLESTDRVLEIKMDDRQESKDARNGQMKQSLHDSSIISFGALHKSSDSKQKDAIHFQKYYSEHSFIDSFLSF